MDGLASLDTALFQQLDTLPHPTWLTVVMTTVSLAARAATIWLLLAAWLALRSDPGAAWRVALALVVSYGVVDGLLKPVIGRERPFAAAIEQRLPPEEARPQSASFPSGHAAAGAAGAFALSRVWRQAAPLLWVLALLIASSRVYLGVHYPMDVVAGLLTGLACGYFVTGGMTYPQMAPTARTRSR